MILLIVLTLVFLGMMLFPFLLARASLDPEKQQSLTVKSNNVRDPRYFSKAFTALMERALAERDGDTIRLSKSERLLEPPLPAGDIDAVVLSQNDFAPGEAHVFLKEIYCRKNGTLPAETTMRAAACAGSLTLGENCRLIRWVDGEKLLDVKTGCQLGISATSANELKIATGCTFRRLYAPTIRIETERRPISPAEQKPSGNIRRDLDCVEDHDLCEDDLVFRDDVVIGEEAQLYGSVKARKRVHVKRGAHILGNLIANDDIVLEGDVFIGGILFSQGRIFVGPNCQIGRKGRIKSVVSRDGVILAAGTLVFGYVSGEHNGETVDAANYYECIGDQY